MENKNTGLAQFCLHQIGRTKNFRLLKSFYPQQNKPASYSIEVGSGTEEEMIALKKEIVVKNFINNNQRE